MDSASGSHSAATPSFPSRGRGGARRSLGPSVGYQASAAGTFASVGSSASPRRAVLSPGVSHHSGGTVTPYRRATTSSLLAGSGHTSVSPHSSTLNARSLSSSGGGISPRRPQTPRTSRRISPRSDRDMPDSTRAGLGSMLVTTAVISPEPYIPSASSRLEDATPGVTSRSLSSPRVGGAGIAYSPRFDGVIGSLATASARTPRLGDVTFQMRSVRYQGVELSYAQKVLATKKERDNRGMSSQSMPNISIASIRSPTRLVDGTSTPSSRFEYYTKVLKSAFVIEATRVFSICVDRINGSERAGTRGVRNSKQEIIEAVNIICNLGTLYKDILGADDDLIKSLNELKQNRVGRGGAEELYQRLFDNQEYQAQCRAQGSIRDRDGRLVAIGSDRGTALQAEVLRGIERQNEEIRMNDELFKKQIKHIQDNIIGSRISALRTGGSSGSFSEPTYASHPPDSFIPANLSEPYQWLKYNLKVFDNPIFKCENKAAYTTACLRRDLDLLIANETIPNPITTKYRNLRSLQETIRRNEEEFSMAMEAMTDFSLTLPGIVPPAVMDHLADDDSEGRVLFPRIIPGSSSGASSSLPDGSSAAVSLPSIGVSASASSFVAPSTVSAGAPSGSASDPGSSLPLDASSSRPHSAGVRSTGGSAGASGPASAPSEGRDSTGGSDPATPAPAPSAGGSAGASDPASAPSEGRDSTGGSDPATPAPAPSAGVSAGASGPASAPSAGRDSTGGSDPAPAPSAGVSAGASDPAPAPSEGRDSTGASGPASAPSTGPDSTGGSGPATPAPAPSAVVSAGASGPAPSVGPDSTGGSGSAISPGVRSTGGSAGASGPAPAPSAGPDLLPPTPSITYRNLLTNVDIGRAYLLLQSFPSAASEIERAQTDPSSTHDYDIERSKYKFIIRKQSPQNALILCLLFAPEQASGLCEMEVETRHIMREYSGDSAEIKALKEEMFNRTVNRIFNFEDRKGIINELKELIGEIRICSLTSRDVSRLEKGVALQREIASPHPEGPASASRLSGGALLGGVGTPPR